MTRTRPLPERKSLGTPYNLVPDTERTDLHNLRTGEVVMESAETPVRISSFSYSPKEGGWMLHVRYVWQTDREPTWRFGPFQRGAMFDRAKKGEY